MNNKKRTGSLIAIILLAAGIVLSTVVCLLFVFGQKMNMPGQKKEEQGTTEEAFLGEYPQEISKQQEIKAFTVGTQVELPEPEETETETEEEPDETENEESEYLCEYSSDRIMTEEDIEELEAGTYDNLPEGRDIIQMVINELYAKNGYEFSTEELREYFGQREWYQAIENKTNDMNQVYQNMSELEKDNTDFLRAYLDGEVM